MRVVCVLDEMMKELSLSDSDLAHELKIDRRTIKKIRLDADNWRLSREALYKLNLFFFKKGYLEGIFEVRASPIWNSLPNAPITIFREKPAWDAQVEHQLREFLSRLKLNSSVEMLSRDTQQADNERQIDFVASAMREQNCIFLGSPKYSIATEIALSLLWQAKPFDPDPENREKVPIHFYGMSVEHRCGRSATILGGERCGLSIRIPGRTDRAFFKVERFSPGAYRSWAGEASDAAAVVVYPQPLATKKPVTTFIIAGYSGLATSLATEEMIYGEPPAPNSPDEPLIAIFKFRYRKRKASEVASLAGLRHPLKETFLWGPPWPRVLEAAETPADR